MMIVLCALALFLCLIAYMVNKRRKYSSLRKWLTGPPTFPIIGSVHYFIKENDTEVLPMLESWMIQYGPNTLFEMFFKTYIFVNEPRMLEFVLGSTKIIDKATEYKFFGDWFGLGLLTSTGKKWKSHRKILTPSFHYKILEEFIKVFDKQSTTMIKKLKCNVGKDSFDIFKPVSLCTLDIICESAMGTEVNAQEDPDSPFVSSVRELCGILYSRCFSPLRFDWIYYFSKTYKKELKVVKVLRTFSENIIQNRKAAIAKETINGCTETDSNEVGLKKKYTFLDCLLRSTIDGEPIPDSDIREEVDTFMFEGHDTTSIAIAFTVYCLSKHLDIQAKVYEELINVYGEDKSASSTIEKLNELKYLEQVIKEGLRLYPPVSIFARILEEDIEFDGVMLPKGLTLVVLPYTTHRDPDLYPDPYKFDPERFTLDNQAKRHPYAYVPFSAGPRNCIGQKFAMLELKCTIAKILRNYEVLPAIPNHEVEPLIRVTLESANGIKIRLRERK